MEWTIAGIIVILIVAVIVFWIVPEVIKAGNQASAREACKTSVLLRAKAKIAGQTLLGDLTCETNILEIDDKNEEIIKQQIATEMFSCWNMFDRGQRDFLGDYDFGKGDNWCHICSRIDFDDSVKNNEDTKVIENFDQYLKDEEVPLIGGSFYSYMYGDYGGETIDPLPGGLNLNTDDSIYVVFFADKRSDYWEDLKNIDAIEVGTLVGSCWAGLKTAGLIGTVWGPAGTVVGGIVGCAGGMLIGGVTEIAGRKTEYVSSLYVGPPNQIVEVCGQ